MNSDLDLLAQAKQRLPLPALMALLGHGEHAKKSAPCPFHSDSHNSFSVWQTENGNWKFKCHAGCGAGDEPDYLAKHRGLANGDACREFIKLAGVTGSASPSSDGSHRVVARYDYRDETGALLFQVVRFEPKTFRQRKPDTASPDGWTWKLGGTRRVLYRLPELIAAVQRNEIIIVAEGEKDVGALVANGLAATCNPAGAGKWQDDYTASLRGAEVVIVADRDEAGRNHARLVASNLHGKAKSLRIVELPDINNCPVKDAHDYFTSGATIDDFLAAVAASQPYTPPPDLHPVPLNHDSKPAIALPPEENDDSANTPKPFPVDLLPPTLARIVSEVARCERVPAALPAVCALGVTCAATGAGLEIVSAGDRITRANLFVLASAESGSGKSQVFRRIAAPILEHQHQVHEAFQEKTAPELASELGLLTREIKRLEAKAAKENTDPADRDRLLGELQYKNSRLIELKQMSMSPCVICGDVTSEKLAVLLAANHETLFSASPEARQLVDIICGRYNSTNRTDEAIYLSGYSGDFLRVDRLGRDPLTLRTPCLSLLWLVQPDAMYRLFKTDTLAQSGFLPRFLICQTRATPKKIIAGEDLAVSYPILKLWAGLIAGLLATYHVADKPYRVEPSPEAKRLLDDFFNAIVDRREGDLSDVGQFASRYAEQAWRVSLTFHAALYGLAAHNHLLDAETARNAIAVVQWFMNEQLDVLARSRRQAAAKVEDEAMQLLEDRTHGKRLEPEERQLGRPIDYVTPRTLVRTRITATAEAARALLARMEADGLLVGQDVSPKGGGPTTRIFRRVRNPVPE